MSLLPLYWLNLEAAPPAPAPPCIVHRTVSFLTSRRRNVSFLTVRRRTVDFVTKWRRNLSC
jgi:hypothetical protein